MLERLVDIDLNLLVYLDLLLEERSVSRAAVRAGITQSAMSRALNRLRDQLEDPLLVSTKNMLEPTERALQIAGPVREVLQRIQTDVLTSKTFDPLHSRRHFSVAAPDFMDALVMRRFVARLETEAPGLTLSLVGVAPVLRGELENGLLDLLLGFPPSDRAALHIRKLFSDRFVGVVRAGHPALHEGKIDLDAYVAYPHVLVTPAGRPGSFVDTALSEVGKTRQVRVRTYSFLLAADYVEASNDILTIPEKVARHSAQHRPLTIVPTPIALPEITLSMVWHARHQNDPAHAWLRNELAQVAKEL